MDTRNPVDSYQELAVLNELTMRAVEQPPEDGNKAQNRVLRVRAAGSIEVYSN
jgi:hypothetical protein